MTSDSDGAVRPRRTFVGTGHPKKHHSLTATARAATLDWFDDVCVFYDRSFHMMTTGTPLVTAGYLHPLTHDYRRSDATRLSSLKDDVIGEPSAAGQDPGQPRVTSHPPLPAKAVVSRYQ